MKLVEFEMPLGLSGFHGVEMARRDSAWHRRVWEPLLAENRALPDLRRALPAEITLTRISAGLLEDNDTLPDSFRHLVAEIAAWIGLPPNDRRLLWRYRQESCPRGQYGIRVRIERPEEAS